MKPKQIIVNHENSKHGYIHWLDNENYQLLELERDVYINENKRLNDIVEKAKKYIDKYLEEHIIEDQPDEQSIFYDEKGYYIPNAKEQLLNILNDKDN